MKRSVVVKFTGTVINVHVKLGGHEIGLSKGDDTWDGKDEIDINGTNVSLELRFVAPSFTDWALVIEIDDKKVFDDDGTSESQKFTLRKNIPVS
jgi:hypothetical protein